MRGCRLAACSVILGALAWGSAAGATPIVIQTAVFGGHTYDLLSQSNWTDAEAAAVGLGGHLATISSAAEDAFVYNTFTSNAQINRGLWIGLNDAAVEGTFVWASGEPVTYTNFAVGEPNNNGGIEDWVHIFWPSDPRASKWNDAPNLDAPFGVPTLGVVELPFVTNGTVPEPSTLMLCGAGLAVAVRRLRRRP